MSWLLRLPCALCLLIVIACGQTEPPQDTSDESINFLAELGGDASDFMRACEPRKIEFPRDHLAHPEFRNEWWYLTGNLKDDKGDRYGFQVTFFRIANSADSASIESNWNTRQFYMGHFAITAGKAAAISAHERFSRAGAGLAGTAENPARVWLEDWQLQQNPNDPKRWTLSVAQGGEGLSLELTQRKPLVLQGDEGLSRKSDDPCNASYYYSLSRLATHGQLRVGDQSFDVTGDTWLDREWSSSALSADQSGWDWFALQMNDGRELMYYRLRSKTGQTDEHSYAVVIGVDGQKDIVDASEITHQVSRWWQSSEGSRYPVAGSLEIPGSDFGKIYYEPLIDDQELLLTVRYWEGAIQLRNEAGRETGRGYLELTGY